MGMCSTDDAGAMCQYNQFNGCLCYRTQGFAAYPCPQVDPSCPNGGAGGTSNEGGAPAAAGVGGISAKIAVPPSQICSCSAGNWTCTFGI
jgi:hypothetical protein